MVDVPGPTAYRVCGILPGEEQYSFTLLFEERSAQISPRAADSESVALVYSVISKLQSTLSKRTIGTPGRAKRLLTVGSVQCLEVKLITLKITPKACMKSAICCGMESRRKPWMESSQSDVWNQSEGKCTLTRDAIPCLGTDSIHRTSRGDSMLILRIG